MDAVLLSRLQFAITIGFHYIFPPLTFGLTLALLIFESLHLRLSSQVYKRLTDYFVKILALVFVLGTATGITMEFSFGTNWSNYSRMVGDVFGAPLAAEGVLAFFLESVFLGVLVFGRNKVTKRQYWWSAFLVFLGAHLSGLWIIVANSWMQTPAGFVMSNGRAVMTDFWDAVVNHSTLIRYTHTAVAGWITGVFFVAGVSAWLLLKRRGQTEARAALPIALIILVGASLLELGLGHGHAMQVAETQPAKMAAFEAQWETQRGAPLALFGLPDERARKTHLYVGLPRMLSWLVAFDPNAEIKGLNAFPEDERPPVALPFYAYHIMITLGMLFIIIPSLGFLLLLRKKLFTCRRYLWLLVFTAPLPQLANQLGWMAAEVGRQPWAVYGVLKTRDAASVVVPAGQILFSLIMFSLLYLFLFIIFLKVLFKIVRKGPEQAQTPAIEGYL